MVQNGVDCPFFISPQCCPPASPVGNGVDELTMWTFDFTGDSGFPAFQACGPPLTSAKLTLHLTPRVSPATDGVAMVDPRFPTFPPLPLFTTSVGSVLMNDQIKSSGTNPVQPLGSFNIVMQEFLDDVSSAAILEMFSGTTTSTSPPGIIWMFYQDDAIVSFAQLDLTKECQSGPSPVGGIAGLLDGGESPAEASASSGRDYTAPIAAAVAAAVIAVAAGGWYARRRFLR